MAATARVVTLQSRVQMYSSMFSVSELFSVGRRPAKDIAYVVVRATSVKFGLHERNIKSRTQNEERA